MGENGCPQKGENDDNTFKDGLDGSDEEDARVSNDRTKSLKKTMSF